MNGTTALLLLFGVFVLWSLGGRYLDRAYPPSETIVYKDQSRLACDGRGDL